MNLTNLFLSASAEIIGSADGPTAVSVAGLPLPALTVALFAVAFVAYVYIAKAIAAKKLPAEAIAVIEKSAPVASVQAPASYTGPVLTGVEEKEAAVIMAIVSDKTGIPLERLKFESIKLMEDK